MIYDQEEQDILNAYETGQVNMRPPSEQELAAIKITADKTLTEERPHMHGKTSIAPP